MSKRNFILLIIIVIIALIAFWGFLYFRQSAPSSEEDTGGTNFISQFNPFGNSKPTASSTTPPVDISEEEPTVPEVNLKLKKISSMPIAGFTVYQKERLKETAKETEFVPALRYVARATGNVYQTFADKIEERKFSTTVIPMVYEAFLGNKGESVIMRYLKVDAKTITTFVGALPKEFLGTSPSASNEIKGIFLPEDTKDLSLSGDTFSLFYLFGSGDNIIGTTFNLKTNKKTQVFDSPFTEWLSSFPNNKIITLTTKPAFRTPGYMYALDPNSKTYNFHQVLGKINGLTTLTSPDGKLALYSDDGLSLGIYHLDTKVSDSLGVKTLSEKCVWNKTSEIIYCAAPKSIDNNQYPDSWYQGEVSFSDQIWKIDIKTGNATIVADPGVTNREDVDGIKLMIDEGENYLFFVNKKDSFLWELGLK